MGGLTLSGNEAHVLLEDAEESLETLLQTLNVYTVSRRSKTDLELVAAAIEHLENILSRIEHVAHVASMDENTHHRYVDLSERYHAALESHDVPIECLSLHATGGHVAVDIREQLLEESLYRKSPRSLDDEKRSLLRSAIDIEQTETASISALTTIKESTEHLYQAKTKVKMADSITVEMHRRIQRFGREENSDNALCCLIALLALLALFIVIVLKLKKLV